MTQGSGQQGRPLTKAIVFSQFWMHIQLINSHLRAHQVPLAVLKQDMTRKDKAAAVATFQVCSPVLGMIMRCWHAATCDSLCCAGHG